MGICHLKHNINFDTLKHENKTKYYENEIFIFI